MRFLSFLPMLLLLLVGSLGAQNPCSIHDLTATVTPIDPASCTYYVVLDFEHSGTTNQYTVKGNGVNYGTFSYDSIPLKLGPFTAGTTPSTKEFVVFDAVLPDCADDVAVQIPACTQSAACDIFDLKVDVGPCNPGGLTYQLKIDFKVTNPGNDFFEVWSANGTYLGIFPISQLPLTFPAFPWSGDPTDKVKVCINDHPDCCETLTFDAPVCDSQDSCSIVDLTVVTGDCTGDSTYKVKVNFALTSPALINQFGVWANNDFVGVFNINDLPLSIDNFPWSGADKDAIKICVLDIIIDPVNPQIVCCKSIEFDTPDCLGEPSCRIKNLEAKADSCTSDSTFGVWVNFTVNDTTAVDSFFLSANGQDLGVFSFDSLPLYIADFPWNNGIFSYVKVCTGNTPDCCAEYQFLAPACLPYDTCEVTDIFVQTGACNSDSTYKLKINFQATNPGDGYFTLWANGDTLGTFPLDTVPLLIDSFPWSGNDTDVVRICINDSLSTASCCLEKEFQAPACVTNDTCTISNVVVDPGDCNPGGQSYSLTLNFTVDNPGSDSFEVWANNGLYLGHFPLSQLPVTIPAFPCNNSGVGVLKICIDDAPGCCTTVEFQAPSCCGSNDPCEISNLTVQTGDCNGTESYEVWLDFDVTNPLNDEFGVWANGEFLGTFPLDSLPLHIDSFPWNGGQKDVVKVCFATSGVIGCCKTLEFEVPDCLPQPCEVYNLKVETGPCTGDSTYNAWVNFQVDNAPGDTFGLWINGNFYDLYVFDSLPVFIEDFPWNGGPNDVVKVCFYNNNDPSQGASCCKTKEFAVPDCIDQGGPCEIYDLTVETGDCTGDSTYHVWINFNVDNAPSDTFGLWANGNFYGYFPLDSLPLHLDSFPWNGGNNDVVKVCLANTNNGCCKTKEFEVPDCLDQGGPCEIYGLTVETGDCTGDSTYNVWINFNVQNAPSGTFGLWINGEFYDTFPLDSLPLHLDSFPWNGGPNDVIKVCVFNSDDPNSGVSCCKIKEFPVPDCLDQGGPCEIYDLTVETGDCSGDSTYAVTINFEVHNAPSDTFGLWANGNFYGYFPLSALPLHLDSFPWNGGNNDVVKVCLANTNNGCCKTKEFEVPDCLDQGGPCHISDLNIDTGDCTSDSTYTVTINFDVSNPPADSFDLWANGNFFGTYSLSDLPLTIQDFPWDGGPTDHVKVCLFEPNAPPGQPFCCKQQPFQVPDCLDDDDDCDIDDLTVETGDCTGNDTYEVWINFEVDNPPGNQVGVWANGDFLGLYNIDSLPIYIADFPWNGGDEDVVKVCFPTAGGGGTCCETEEFNVPDCLTQDPCKIYDLHVVTTPCLCGQFFALVTFKFDNTGDDGFDIMGNGTNYGNFPYNYPQPVIIGPLNGDGTTDYEFVVKDHQDPDCADDFHLGTVDCMTPVVNPGGDAQLTLSPNPASNWLNVTAKLQNGSPVGEADVEIYHADGRLVRTQTVSNGSNFQLDVADLPAGVYRLSLRAASGRVEGTFARQ